MSMMGQVIGQELEWFAVRAKQQQVGGVRTATVGGQFEAYRSRTGAERQRRVVGTGQRVFVPEHILKRAGFEVFLPVKRELKLKNRFSNEKHWVAKPLLVDWMFVGWPVGESRWHELMSHDVVAGVMGTGGRPVQIPARRVMRLMQAWGGGKLSPNLHRYVKAGCDFVPGDKVRVVDGPFEGKEVRVVDVKGASVKALLKILGGDIEVEMCSTSMVAVPPPFVC
ncbi:transcription termination/antitermination protein NusG [Aliiroseovarius lamellibrachiae]|uniref:transcription termination/antitermination protein NusG n=1 Tax=Aliiroseovarius lamellibrachiae TaxID=1924933 RepID=UPI001BE091F4|nr:transcription termination/antitermination NusG family protein [Aliiroseovarius lamellibrachiae]MBT2130107.1 KOW motif-containing protein [Aliiroseovarius lamellibrachiae]